MRGLLQRLECRGYCVGRVPSYCGRTRRRCCSLGRVTLIRCSSFYEEVPWTRQVEVPEEVGAVLPLQCERAAPPTQRVACDPQGACRSAEEWAGGRQPAARCSVRSGGAHVGKRDAAAADPRCLCRVVGQLNLHAAWGGGEVLSCRRGWSATVTQLMVWVQVANNRCRTKTTNGARKLSSVSSCRERLQRFTMCMLGQAGGHTRKAVVSRQLVPRATTGARTAESGAPRRPRHRHAHCRPGGSHCSQ
ncbi:hypothetical protein TCSYLVIO_006530 [Trypanosoma cruzi]|nr:hypothetical protein TCSYLVIO_006530 [Trypanosoma cruzi]